MNETPFLPSQLAPFTSNERVRAIVERAARRYADLVYEHDNEIIRYVAGDGMAWHSAFNRGLAVGFEKGARRAGWEFKTSHDARVPFAGDLVWTERVRGQVRFRMQLGGHKFSLLHMTGEVDAQRKTLDVMALGPTRREWLQGQNCSVVRPETPNLFNQDEDGFRLRPHSEEPLHVVLMTQRRGHADLMVYAGVPTNNWDGPGTILLAEVEHLFDVPIVSKTGKGRVLHLPDFDKAA